LYVVRVGNDCRTKDSAPCSKCAETIKKFGIKKIIYSMGEETYKCVNTKYYEAKSECSGIRWMNKI
jgi:deoxycytidylate deaminase